MIKARKYYRFSMFVVILSVLMFGLSAPAQADVMWNWTWNGMMTKSMDYPTAESGWVTLTVNNNTSFVWGDMHFEILSCSPGAGCNAIDNVGFLDGTFDMMTTPDTDRSPYTYSIDNVSVGATLDYYYYSDPIFTGGDSGLFKFKIDNPDGTLYTLAVTPSVVPEPISSTLFVIGGSILGFRRFRKKK